MKKVMLVVLSGLVLSGCALQAGYRKSYSDGTTEKAGVFVEGHETNIKDGFHSTKAPN